MQKLNEYQKTKEIDGYDEVIHVFVVKGVDQAQCENTGADPEEGSAGMRIGTAENFLKEGNVTRVTRLALKDYLTGK